MRLAKVLAVIAAIFLVSAVAIATLAPDNMTLAEGLGTLDQPSLRAAERFVRARLSPWLWDHPLKALLGRPLWLVPASLGLLLVGAAGTAASSGNALNSRRRRS